MPQKSPQKPSGAAVQRGDDSSPPRRRFPPPWTVEDNGTSWCVSDATGFKITWFHYSHRQGMDTVGERMTKREAYAMAVNFARLPELLRRG